MIWLFCLCLRLSCRWCVRFVVMLLLNLICLIMVVIVVMYNWIGFLCCGMWWLCLSCCWSFGSGVFLLLVVWIIVVIIILVMCKFMLICLRLKVMMCRLLEYWCILCWVGLMIWWFLFLFSILMVNWCGWFFMSWCIRLCMCLVICFLMKGLWWWWKSWVWNVGWWCVMIWWWFRFISVLLFVSVSFWFCWISIVIGWRRIMIVMLVMLISVSVRWLFLMFCVLNMCRLSLFVGMVMLGMIVGLWCCCLMCILYWWGCIMIWFLFFVSCLFVVVVFLIFMKRCVYWYVWIRLYVMLCWEMCFWLWVRWRWKCFLFVLWNGLRVRIWCIMLDEF